MEEKEMDEEELFKVRPLGTEEKGFIIKDIGNQFTGIRNGFPCSGFKPS